MENYIVTEMIGEGAFGKVYKGQRKRTNQIVAIKKIIKKGKKEKELKNLRQEIDILRKLYHENIVQLLDSFETNAEFCLVTELAQGQLFEILEEDKKLPENEIKKISQQLTSALFYLHTNNIIHRDIKPQNVLISAGGIIKLCDFGFARAIDNKQMITSIKGTPLYMAPELLKEYPYNQKADLWSLGVILYELFVGQPPFYTNNFTTLMNKIQHDSIKYPESMSPNFKDFLKGLLIKNPKDRIDWPRIIEHSFIKETEQEKAARVAIQDSYITWIVRLKNEKIFNLYDCDSFLSKFANDREVENNTKYFSAFDSANPIFEKTNNFSNNPSSVNSNNTLKKNNSDLLKEDYWVMAENKGSTDEGATSLRKDSAFSDKIVTVFKSLLDNDRILDKKLICFVVKILFNVLTKGKFENQNIDITKNQNILTLAMNIFKVSQNDDSLHPLLNDIIKVIGLFAKFYCYYSNGIDLSFSSGFLRYVPTIISQTTKPSNIHINLIKAVGIMITAANMAPKRSLMFYKSILDFYLINVLFSIVKNFKTYSYVLVKSCVECLAILIHPMNGEIANFPMMRNESGENRFEGYNEYKTPFSHIETLKRHFITVFAEENISEVLPSLYELDNDPSLRSAILKILLQLFRFSPREMVVYFKQNSPYIGLLNNVIVLEDNENKSLAQIGLLITCEVVRYFNANKINCLDLGYDLTKAANYVNKTIAYETSTICLSFNLVAECLSIPNNGSNNFMIFNSKFIKIMKDMIRGVQGRGKDENKKIEGTCFGFPKNSILDYPVLYLEKIFKVILNKDKYKSEFFVTLTENLFDDLLLDLISNSSYKYDISPKGILSVLNFMHDLIVNDYKILFKKVLRDHFLKQLTNFIKAKQYQAIQDWPGYKKEEGVLIAQGILTTVLKIIKISSEVNGITEEVIKGDFFQNLKNSFEITNKDSHKLIISIIHNLVNGKGNNDDIVNNITTDHFSQYPNLKFIESFNLMKDYFNKDLIIEILLFLSCLCRKSQNVYSALHQLNILPDLKFLLEGNDSSIKSRVCNLLGNMCRHTDFFYDELRISGIVPALLKCCFDPDKSTRKFACFAIGNAAFMNDKLYENFRSIIPKMVELLRDPEDNTRANSAGALGNFVRCGDSLSNDILANKAHEALLQLAENEELPAQISIIKVALFALGNFCYHQVIKIELEKINFRSRIDNLRTKFRSEPQLLEHIERIRKKLRE